MTDDENQDGPRARLSSPQTAESGSGVVPVGIKAPSRTEGDPWRLNEWNALPDRCAIDGCDTEDADQRGPVMLRDGSIHKVCTEHWEAIFRILGEQAAWERTDGYRP